MFRGQSPTGAVVNEDRVEEFRFGSCHRLADQIDLMGEDSRQFRAAVEFTPEFPVLLI